jgi:hypothetical protein
LCTCICHIAYCYMQAVSIECLLVNVVLLGS